MKHNKLFQTKSLILAITLFIIGAWALVACNADTNTQASAPEKVTFQMAWVHDYSASGYYATVHNGHFAEQNLEVDIKKGGFTDDGRISPTAEVLAGNADFGATSASGLLTARSEGKPIVAVAAITQRSPFALISLAEKNIARPSDLLGQRVSVQAGGSNALYNALLSSQNIDPAKVNTVPRTTFGIDSLVNGKVDVLGGWIINEGILVQEAGLEPNFILPSDYGIDTYQSLIFTTETMIAERPDLVERFVRAVIQGHQDVADKPQQAVEFTLTYDDSLVSEEQERRLQAWLPLMNPAGSPIGMMQSKIWELTHQILLAEGILEKEVDIEAAYTLTFLEKVYGEQITSK